jgi:hypothetical protein
VLKWLRSTPVPVEDAGAAHDPAGEAPPAARAEAHVAAAEAALRAGETGTAKRCYGEAIDTWIACDDLVRAGDVCRRLLEVDPAIVRVHCTLTFLALARGDAEAVRESLAAYVEAALRQGAEAFARPSIQLMARATADSRIKGWLADALDRLGDPAAATRMRSGPGSGAALQKLIDDGGTDRWRRLLQSATVARISGGA